LNAGFDAVRQRPLLVWFGLALIGFSRMALRPGPDADFDFRNYHLYDAYAALHGRLSFDIAAAQRQTYLNPALDLIGYGLRGPLNAHPAVFAILMSVPNALAFVLTLRIGLAVLPSELRGRMGFAAFAAFIGATGAASLSTIATAMSDMIPVCLVLWGLLILLSSPAQAQSPRRVAAAAAAFGMAAGLKLTVMPECVGLVCAILAYGGGLRAGIARAALCLAGMAAGFALVAGPWCIVMLRHFGSPLFPFYNQIFRSPFVPPVSFADDRFMPHGAAQALLYPFAWAFHPTTAVSELAVRDPRFALAWAAVIVFVAGWIVSRDHSAGTRKCVFLIVFYAVAFGAWEAAFSIFRYLAPLQAVTGIVVLAAARPLWHRPRSLLAFMGLVTLTCLWLTIIPNWGHADRRGPAIAIALPAMAPDSLVMILDASPAAYLATVAPPSVRWVGANNNLIGPGRQGALEEMAESTIRNSKGPLWGIDYPPVPGPADQTLAYYGLQRAGCQQVTSNLDRNGLRLCRLSRAP
jgi:hypothetical protein